MGNLASILAYAAQVVFGKGEGPIVSSSMYTIQNVPGKGKGLVATDDIPKGTRITSEKPIMTMSHSATSMEQLEIRIVQKLNNLSSHQQQDFLSMANIYPYTTAAQRNLGILRTNGLPTGSDLQTAGIFSIACRINHACDHNAQNFWNDNLNQLTIHAVRDIRKGEEITIEYSNMRRDRRTRQHELWQNFKFQCTCRLCMLPEVESSLSDAKFERIHYIDCLIEQGGLQGLVSSPRRMLRYVDEQVQLWNKEPATSVIGLGRAYPDAFELAIANGDLARASVFAERLVPLFLTSMGPDSPDVVRFRELALNPAKHEYYGMSMQWKTTLKDVPQGLGPRKFEKWLWRR
ncbi:hypothetical protein NX059_007099 [Plenodomus lindquistii]|nr:hypothetical protein NX059_007099 [Plenodomus lindquistii]